jgi:hypothetical protein
MKENEGPRLRDTAIGQALRRNVKPFVAGIASGVVGIVGIALASAPDAHAATPTSGVERCMQVLNNAGFAGPELCEPLIKPVTLPACPEEDSEDCLWDAATRGENRSGQSFVRLGGHTYILAN